MPIREKVSRQAGTRDSMGQCEVGRWYRDRHRQMMTLWRLGIVLISGSMTKENKRRK